MHFTIFDAFMLIYLKGLEENKTLLQHLSQVNFHLDEANSDKEAKATIKKFMLENPKLLHHANLKILQGCSDKKFSLEQLNSIKITHIYSPEELTENLKNIIRSKKPNAIYTNPDILIKLSNDTEVEYVSIELKSTKKNEIPGSSVQQINPYEWVIFIKQGDPIQITTGLYLNSITEKMQFPDRSPRPQVAFNTLKNWNKNNFTLQNNEFKFKVTQSEWNNKNKLINNWKLVLVEQWFKIILDDNLTLTERSPWFNEALVMYADKIIEYYETLSESDKIKFHNKLKGCLRKH